MYAIVLLMFSVLTWFCCAIVDVRSVWEVLRILLRLSSGRCATRLFGFMGLAHRAFVWVGSRKK